MPYISKKGAAMPPSPIRKLVPYAEAASKAGKRIYHLNIGQPDINTPEIAMDAMHTLTRKVLEYTHSAGLESYRRRLAEYYVKNDIHVDWEEIIVTTGGSEAISFALLSTMDPGDEVIIPEPFYANYNGFATASGVNIVAINSTIDDGFSLPPVEEFEDKITERTRAIIICNPNNPTGYLYSEKELRTLADIVKRHNLYLIADEVYREFCYDGREHFSILNLEGLEENAIVVDSISKRFSACGARIGAFISRNKEVMNIVLKFAQARLSPPTLGQIIGEVALKVDQSYFTEVYDEYVSRRDLVTEALRKMEHVKCPTPGGAFYAIAELPVDDADKFCQWMLESFDHNGATVMMAPASGFYSNPELGKHQVRIAYVINKEGLEEAMECLEAGLKVYPGRTVSIEQLSN